MSCCSSASCAACMDTAACASHTLALAALPVPYPVPERVWGSDFEMGVSAWVVLPSFGNKNNMSKIDKAEGESLLRIAPEQWCEADNQINGGILAGSNLDRSVLYDCVLLADGWEEEGRKNREESINLSN